MSAALIRLRPSDLSDNVAASTTVHIPMVGNGIVAGASGLGEAGANTTFRSGGVLSNLYAKVYANTRGTSSVITRKDATSDGAQALSITASTTGEFQDVTNTDTVTAAEQWCFKLVTGAGGTTFLITVLSVVFTATTNTVSKIGCCNPNGRTLSASTTRYHTFGGDCLTTTIAEAAAQIKMYSAGTLKNLMVYCSTAPTNAVTIRTRVAGANGALSVSVNGTGVFEDTSNTDTLSAGSLANFQIVTGATTQAVISQISVELTTTDSKMMLSVSEDFGLAQTAGLTRYTAVAGYMGANSATETDWRANVNVACTASKLHCSITANTIVSDSTLRLRVNGANGNQVVTITALTTGIFEDTSNSDVLAATDEVAYEIVTPSTATSITLRYIAMMLTASSSTFTPRLTLLGVG